MRKVICYVLSIVMLICLTGCSFSVGDPSLKEKNGYRDLFTWGNDTNKFSMKSYVVDLKQYGKAEFHVDTSFGHEFELHGETNTFEVKDKDGQTVIDGIFVNQDNYKALSAGYADLEIENINNRDFAVTFDENGKKYLAFTYLADCGMDLGCILASADTDNFKYLAFTGEALEGSSSDIQYYLGKAETAQPEPGVTDGETEKTAPVKEAEDNDVQSANETVENQNSDSTGSTEGETVFSTYIIPDGFENIYDGEYNKYYQSDKMEITVYAQPDEEYKRFLDGETDSYFDIYTLQEVASFEAGSHGKVVIAEADSDGIFTYFAGNADGTVNIQFSQRSYEKISASDCEAFIKQLIK